MRLALLSYSVENLNVSMIGRELHFVEERSCMGGGELFFGLN